MFQNSFWSFKHKFPFLYAKYYERVEVRRTNFQIFSICIQKRDRPLAAGSIFSDHLTLQFLGQTQSQALSIRDFMTTYSAIKPQDSPFLKQFSEFSRICSTLQRLLYFLWLLLWVFSQFELLTCLSILWVYSRVTGVIHS